jgi:magnesium chelatase family protein
LLDRIDMQINMEEPTDQVGAIFGATPRQGSQTAAMRDAVAAARELAKSRFKTTGVWLNRDVSSRDILSTFGVGTSEALAWIEQITPKHASARSLIRCLRVARTIADVEGRAEVLSEDVERAWGWQAWSAARQRGEVLPI